MIITIQAIREAGCRCGRKITRAITATWTRKSSSAPSVEKNEYSVMPSLVLYQSPAPLTLVHSLLRRLHLRDHRLRAHVRQDPCKLLQTLASRRIQEPYPSGRKGTNRPPTNV